MNKLTTGAYSKHSLIDIIDRFNAGNTTNQVNVSDFDGTIFRGTTGHILQGMSIAYLSLYTLPELIFDPKQFLKFIKNNLLLGKEIAKAGRIEDKIKRTTHEGQVMSNYCNNVLKDIPIKTIHKRAKTIMRHIYWNSSDMFAYFAEISKKSILITKTIEPVVKAYSNHIKRKYNVDIDYFANLLLTENEKIKGIDMTHPVLTCYDKANYLQHYLSKLDDVKYLIITGDTNEDISMFEIGDSLFGKENCLKIANHPKDKRIIEKADLVIYNATSLKKILSKARTEKLNQIQYAKQIIVPKITNSNIVPISSLKSIEPIAINNEYNLKIIPKI